MAVSYGTVAVPSARAAVSATDPKGFGRIGYEVGSGAQSVWLGTQVPSKESGGVVAYCIQGGKSTPATGDQVISVATLDISTPRVSGLELTTPQMAYLLDKYKDSKDPAVQSALSLLVHANFEEDSTGSTVYSDPSAQNVVSDILKIVRANAPQIETQAQAYVAEAKASAAVGYQPGGVVGDTLRKGNIHSIGITNQAGTYIANVPLTITLSGPVVFNSTGTNTWSGTTQSQPLSLDWTATGNGQVSYSFTYKAARKTLTKLVNGQVQDTITYGNPAVGDPEEFTVSGPSWSVTYDFQPMGTSQLAKISDTGSFTDTFDAVSDPSYGGGKWLNLDGTQTPVPVTYTATAYYVGDTPPTQSGTVPAGATKIGSVDVVAKGPGKLTADFKADKPGFATVVWSVTKSAQPADVQQYIHADWADAYGIHAETTSYRRSVEVDSTMTIRETKSGTYLVDDLFVTGFPADHPDFTGDGYFAADTKVMKQTLLFFPEGQPVTEANKSNGEVIASVDVPAKNGFHANIGATDFKVKQDAVGNIPGTYVFVTSFAGDDRVKAFTSSVEDKNEQYLVSRLRPTLQTTASDTADGDKQVKPEPKQIITDKIWDVNKSLVPNTEYEIITTLHLTDGTPLLDEQGKPVFKRSVFAPQRSDDIASVSIEFDASKLAGKSVVVFEDIKQAGQTIAVHHDVNEKLQTVHVLEQTPLVPAKQAGLAITGSTTPMLGAASGGMLALGIGLLLMRRKDRI
ncbi:VaFE repeat-containing surface-anchored protein [Arcanobacterium bovis]|uniref:T-Q ester bond containing domain-containing protein n=1 Tax=Arcanobacterium bovis TaxID=2529275 RepID=A0A4Q9UYN2_9ACTO|nr:VaFE repeat-containing surface-anchored protein [Arcanobacterium bovis]TBW20796.1 hypothetical protein EZJ44_08100 [Arcanobacterium bovis]